jgi:acyl carrier protein
MDKQVIHDKVADVIHELFDIERARITLDATFQDLLLTSIDAIDLVVELQRFMGRKVPEEGLRNARTIGDVVDMVHAQLNLAQPA